MVQNVDELACCLQVQRLQRYATYGHLKQLVLKMITDAMHDHQGTSESLQQVRCANAVQLLCAYPKYWLCFLGYGLKTAGFDSLPSLQTIACLEADIAD